MSTEELYKEFGDHSITDPLPQKSRSGGFCDPPESIQRKMN